MAISCERRIPRQELSPPHMLDRYRHIIWDWNGTLLDDVDLLIDIMNGLLRRHRLPLLDRARYHRIFEHLAALRAALGLAEK